MQIERLRAEITAATNALQPAGLRMAAIVLEKACQQFGYPTNWDEISEDYLEELEQVPADLLNKIWPAIRRNCRFFPKIPELLAPIEDEWSNRKFKRLRLMAALGSLS